MEFQQLGNTGVFVSRLCMGAMTFGGVGTVFESIGGLQQPETDRLVGQALDGGINFFDTANVYGLGESETQLGRALGNRRHEVVIASKVFGRMAPGANDVGLSRLHILQQAEASLKRMNTDYIDLYQIHGFDHLTPLEETMKALDTLVRQGKVRYIGCSTLAAWQVMKANMTSALLGLESFATVQSYYSLAGRDIERELVPMLIDQKIGLLPWSPLAGGFLSGKFTRNTSDETARRSKFDFPPIDKERTFRILDVLAEVGKGQNASVAQVALAWLLHQPHVTSVIIGAKKASQLEDNLGSVKVKLTDDDLRRLNEASALPSEYPGWMFAFQGSDRRPGQSRDWSKLAKET